MRPCVRVPTRNLFVRACVCVGGHTSNLVFRTFCQIAKDKKRSVSWCQHAMFPMLIKHPQNNNT